MSELPRVMVGGPVRDREWSVPLWLGGLLRLDWPRDRLTLAVAANDCRDATFEAAAWWVHRAGAEGWRRNCLRYDNFGTEADNTRRVGRRDYRAFARARDAWVAMLGDEEWLLEVDSDVVVQPETLLELYRLATEHGLPMLAAVIDNSHGAPEWFRNVCQREDGRLRHDIRAWGLSDGVYPCALTGACVLLHRSIFDAGVRYEVPAVGPDCSEDEPFCDAVAALGVPPHYAPGVRCMHWMQAPIETGYLRDPDHHARLARFHAAEASRLEAEHGDAQAA